MVERMTTYTKVSELTECMAHLCDKGLCAGSHVMAGNDFVERDRYQRAQQVAERTLEGLKLGKRGVRLQWYVAKRYGSFNPATWLANFQIVAEVVKFWKSRQVDNRGGS
jgi:hypothetical protein